MVDLPDKCPECGDPKFSVNIHTGDLICRMLDGCDYRLFLDDWWPGETGVLTFEGLESYADSLEGWKRAEDQHTTEWSTGRGRGRTTIHLARRKSDKGKPEGWAQMWASSHEDITLEAILEHAARRLEVSVQSLWDGKAGESPIAKADPDAFDAEAVAKAEPPGRVKGHECGSLEPMPGFEMRYADELRRLADLVEQGAVESVAVVTVGGQDGLDCTMLHEWKANADLYTLIAGLTRITHKVQLALDRE